VTPADLRHLNGLYTRWCYLDGLRKRTQAQGAELWLLIRDLEDLGFDVKGTVVPIQITARPKGDRPDRGD
jgi:hypothetical protein